MDRILSVDLLINHLRIQFVVFSFNNFVTYKHVVTQSAFFNHSKSQKTSFSFFEEILILKRKFWSSGRRQRTVRSDTSGLTKFGLDEGPGQSVAKVILYLVCSMVVGS